MGTTVTKQKSDEIYQALRAVKNPADLTKRKFPKGISGSDLAVLCRVAKQVEQNEFYEFVQTQETPVIKLSNQDMAVLSSGGYTASLAVLISTTGPTFPILFPSDDPSKPG